MAPFAMLEGYTPTVSIKSMEEKYAILPDRVKAAVIDAIVHIAAMYGISEFLNVFEHVPDGVRIMAAILIFLLYDPFFTSFYGATIGHSYSNIRVKKDADTTKNISFPIAVVCFILKASLGWISLLTVTGTKKRKAIHDFVAKSVVVAVAD
ncbi:MAG: RDD family protein [Maribacter sp.]|uniref:RDD family protein n=1 Tax=Maribacter sp. TaxID=1897614 RepID=UPI003C754877